MIVIAPSESNTFGAQILLATQRGRIPPGELSLVGWAFWDIEKKIEKQMEKKVVVLIGGTSGSGKTKLANTLMKSLGIPYISVDHLMMGIYRSNNDCGFTPISPVSVINRHIWPIVREMVKTNIENDHSIIFEGFQMLPQNIKDFSGEYASQVLPFFLALSPEYIKAHYDDIGKYRSVIESRSDIEDIDTLIRMNIELINDCTAASANCRIVRSHYEDEIHRTAQEIAFTFDVNLPQQTD